MLTYEQYIENELSRLQSLIGCSSLEISEDTNVIPCMTVWKLWNNHTVVGQLNARFGSEFADEPDGFAAYFEGYNWTDYCPTVEECAKQHEERKFSL